VGAMSFFWDIFERLSDVVGQGGALVCVAIVIGVAGYFVLGSASPSDR
jgi:hypothetical protein